MLQLATFVMVLLMFLPTAKGLLGSAWSFVSGLASGLVAKVKGLLGQ